ncbi:hypothetical protein [Actinomadura rugatobispora]|uniref:Uncharacterized protein n=1 Tax=Actinomadura rugatobispora TaxID=1994 RepID=A0ABW0ZZV3_9ACTN|nr:hypothetical protein GCM10010200_039990 [Actinomadura rugatobispora]
MLLGHIAVFRATGGDIATSIMAILVMLFGGGPLLHRDVRAHNGVFARSRRPEVPVPASVEHAGTVLGWLSWGLAAMLLFLAVTGDDLLGGLRSWGGWIALWGAVAAAHFVTADQVKRGKSWSRRLATVLAGVYGLIGLALLVFAQAIPSALLLMLATPVVLLHSSEARAYHRSVPPRRGA